MNLLDKIKDSVPQINEKNQNYILGGILLFIFLIDYFLIMNPQLKTLRTLNPKIRLLAEDLKTAKDDITRMEQYQSSVATFRAQVELLNSSLISKEGIPLVLENISRTANKFGVKIDQLKPLKEEQGLVLENKEGKFSALPILVNAQGSYHNMGRFINQIEENNAFLSIVDLKFTAGPEQQKSKHLARFTIRAIIFDRTEGQ